MIDNVKPIREAMVKRNASETFQKLMTEEFLLFMLNEGEKQFKTKAEQKAFVIGGASALGFYGAELKRGLGKL